MNEPVNVEFAVDNCSSLEDEVNDQSSSATATLSTASDTDENDSSQNGLCSRTATRLPSFCKFEGNTGLKPSRNHFDHAVIKRLDNFFDDTVTEFLEEERLKTFLRIRPSSNDAVDKKLRGQHKRVIELKDETTILAHTLQKTVDCFGTRHRTRAGRDKKIEFKFTKVLGPNCGQTAVFEECMAPLIERFLRQENCLVFTYGATNSGKTYTLQGHGTEYGIIPRTLDVIFSRIQDRLFKRGDIKPHLYQNFYHLAAREVEIYHQRKEEILREAEQVKTELMTLKENISFAGSQSSSQGSTVNLVGVGEYSETNYALFANTTMYSVWVSFAELYNDKVYDLLEAINTGKTKRRKERKLLQDKNGFVYIKDLTELHVTSDDEAYKLFLAGRKNLQFAATQMNQRSSRSHSFFTIRVVSVGIGDGLMPYPKSVHRMTFCDLAGMERASQTENEGERLKESSNINTSLTVLLKVIRLLREKQAQGNKAIETIPFRESKLTHIFKNYLTSPTHICMIVNVNPDIEMADSTLQVLHNSAIASNVIAFRPIDMEKEQTKKLPPLRSKDGIKKPASDDKENEDPSKFINPKKRRYQRPKEAMSSTASSQSLSDTDVDGKKVNCDGFSSSDSETSNGQQTVVATNKFLLHRVAELEKEVVELKIQLARCEHEKQTIREEVVKFVNQQNQFWSNKFTEYERVRVEENIRARKLSILQPSNAALSPGSKCGRNHTPPKIYMDNIEEDVDEDDNDSSEGESKVDGNSTVVFNS